MTSKHRWLFNFHKTIEEKTLESLETEESGHACSLETHPNDILHQNRSEQSCIFDHLKSARELRHSIHVQVLGWSCYELVKKKRKLQNLCLCSQLASVLLIVVNEGAEHAFNTEELHVISGTERIYPRKGYKN